MIGSCLVEREPARARALLAEARVWALRSCEVEAELRCHERALRLAQTPAEASAVLHAGLTLAAEVGFDRFGARLRAAAS